MNEQHFEIGETKIVLLPADGVWMPSVNGLFYANAIKIGQGERVLDIGTGSGVLAIMAAKRGATVEATDTDERAIQSSLKNAVINQVEFKTHFGAMFADCSGTFDVIMANLPNEIVAPSELQKIDQKDAKVFEGGERGNEFILELLEKASNYMTSSSRLYFALHTLTDYHQTLEAALEKYEIRLLSFARLPVKGFISADLDFYKPLNDSGVIHIYSDNGQWYSLGYVYECKLKA